MEEQLVRETTKHKKLVARWMIIVPKTSQQVWRNTPGSHEVCDECILDFSVILKLSAIY